MHPWWLYVLSPFFVSASVNEDWMGTKVEVRRMLLGGRGGIKFSECAGRIPLHLLSSHVSRTHCIKRMNPWWLLVASVLAVPCVESDMRIEWCGVYCCDSALVLLADMRNSILFICSLTTCCLFLKFPQTAKTASKCFPSHPRRERPLAFSCGCSPCWLTGALHFFFPRRQSPTS